MSPKKSDLPKLACGSKGMRGSLSRMPFARAPKNSPRLERVQEREQGSLLPCVQAREAVPRVGALAVVREDGALRRQRSPVMEERRVCAQAPQRRGAHLARPRRSLGDAVAQGAHVVQQEVGVGMEDLLIE